MSEPFDPEVLALVLGVTFGAATVQGTVGLGFAILSVPVLSLVDPRLAPVPQLLVTLPMTLYMAWRERREIEWRATVWVLAGRPPGALLGLWLLKVANARVLDAIIGATVLAAALVLGTGASVRRTRVTELLAGLSSGVTGLVSSIGGPPLALLYGRSHGPTLRSTLAAIFSVGVVITIGTRAVAGEVDRLEVELAAMMLPALLLGLAVSNRLRHRVSAPVLRAAVLGLSALAAVGLLVRAAGS